MHNQTVGEIVAFFHHNQVTFSKNIRLTSVVVEAIHLNKQLQKGIDKESKFLYELEDYYLNHSRKNNEKDWRGVKSD